MRARACRLNSQYHRQVAGRSCHDWVSLCVVQEVRDGGDMSSHHMAMFGAVGSSVVFTKTEPMDRTQTALEDNPETLFDPSVSQAEPRDPV